jgi:hypothetical protein
MRTHIVGGCTQAADAIQQRKSGATIFHCEVAPKYAFSDKASFLLPNGADEALF